MGTALVTGASSGLGEAFAEVLASRGHRVVLVARRRARLEALARRLEDDYGVDTEVLVANVGTEEGLASVSARIGAAAHPVGLLVNNAGFGLGQPFVGGDLAREQAALDVMVRAVLVLTHCAAGHMAARGRGGIINVSSIAAGTAMGTYAAHKTWVNAFSEAIAGELRPRGVRVVSLRPGTIATEFWEGIGQDSDQVATPLMLSARRVARSALAALDAGRVTCVPAWQYRLIDAVRAKAPRGIVRAVTYALHDRRFHL